MTTFINMRSWGGLVVGTVGTLMLTGMGLSAQARGGSVTADAQVQQRRFQFQLMEGVLENAVRQGAVEVAMRAQTTIPIGTLFMGQARAKGFPLDGYGVVFDIEIPIIRESAVLAGRLMVSPVPPPGTAQTVSGRGAAGTPVRSSGATPDDVMTRSAVGADPFLAAPNQFYRDAVRDKIIDAMLDYSRSLSVAPGESLSIVARSEDDPLRNSLRDDSRTLILRIKGEDLALFHTGKLARDEVKKRVIESQF